MSTLLILCRLPVLVSLVLNSRMKTLFVVFYVLVGVVLCLPVDKNGFAIVPKIGRVPLPCVHEVPSGSHVSCTTMTTLIIAIISNFVPTINSNDKYDTIDSVVPYLLLIICSLDKRRHSCGSHGRYFFCLSILQEPGIIQSELSST